MSELGLDFELGEMADTIRDTTRRFAADRIAPLAARIDAEDWFPTRAVAGNGRARPARHHRRGGGWRARARLSRACRRAGGGGAGLGLDRPLLRRPFEPLRQPDPALGEPGAEGEISAQADLAASMSARSPCRRPGAGSDVVGDEAEGRGGAGRLRPQRHQILDHQRRTMPTRSSSTPRPARARAASPPS